MASRKPPESWLWSHDVQPKRIDNIDLPGMHLVRLCIYGETDLRRFAAIIYKDGATESRYLVEVPAAEVLAKLGEIDAHPVSITADVDGGVLRYALVLHKGPSSLASVHLGLDEAAFLALADEQHCIVDFTTYVLDGARKYSAIVEERPGPCWILPNVTAQELDAKVVSLGATLTRIRRLGAEGTGPVRYTATAERLNVGRWAWFTAIPGSVVAKKLDENDGYPVDLEAFREPGTEYGVHYTVLMYKDRPS